jgi:hypothetical protein
MVDHDFDEAHAVLLDSGTPRDLRAKVLETLESDQPRLASLARATVGPKRSVTVPAEPRVLIEIAAAPPLDAPARTLVAKLADQPADPELMRLLADHLQQRGHPLGELIALDLAGGDEGEVNARREAVRMQLTPQLDPHDGFGWGTGFLKRLRLGPPRFAALEHPSAALLWRAELSAPGFAELPIDRLPLSLRELVLSSDREADDLALGRLSHLRVLTVNGPVPERITHPTVESLSLDSPSGPLEPLLLALHDTLPQLRRLSIARCRNQPVTTVLARAACLQQLVEVELRGVGFHEAALAALEKGMKGRRLQKLDVTGNQLPRRFEGRLAGLCHTLVFSDAVAEPEHEWWIHTGKPEWGRARLVARRGDTVELEFGSTVRKFKADAKFLKVVYD